jgi:hypothetical protein
MSEPEKPTRKFWQFHLSTAVATMLFAGLSLPIPIWAYRHAQTWSPYDTAKGNVGINFFAFIFLIYAASVVCFSSVIEWLIRRREARKT